MYYYIYDSYLNNKRYNKTVAQIETRLTDLGINGKINHLSFLKNIKQMLSDEIKRGVRTIVVVGNDKTIGQVINIIANLNVTLGIIPIGDNNKIARLLGIPSGEQACDILSSRIVEKIDLGRVNNYYFLTSIEMIGRHTTLECDGNYVINLENEENIVNISNLNFYQNILTSPVDGKMDVFVQSLKRKIIKKITVSKSHLTAKDIRITSQKPMHVLLTDEKKIIKTPATIKTIAKKIKIVVGRNRQY